MVFLWYPKCSTCQRAKKWLDAHGVTAEVRDIREEAPTRDELERWQRLSGLPLKKFFNTSGQAYRALDLKDRLAAMDREEQLELLAGDGMLVKRPILVKDDTVLVGFKEADWEAAMG